MVHFFHLASSRSRAPLRAPLPSKLRLILDGNPSALGCGAPVTPSGARAQQLRRHLVRSTGRIFQCLQLSAEVVLLQKRRSVVSGWDTLGFHWRLPGSDRKHAKG